MYTKICLSLDFSHKCFYKRDVKDMIYAESVSHNLSHWVVGVFHSISRMKTLSFLTGFLKDYKSTLIFFPRGFLRSFNINDTYFKYTKEVL
jgi:hypothetical protein